MGLPGTGKTTAARRLEAEHGAQRDRLAKRLAEAPHETWPISDRELANWAAAFDPPTPGELDGSEPVGDPPAGVATWQEWAADRWRTSIDREE